MNDDFSRYVFWTLAIVVAWAAIVMYQHATHTNAIISMLGNGSGDGPQPDPMALSTISSNPNMYGAGSRASGQWTPLGPVNGTSVFPYNPPQAIQ